MNNGTADQRKIVSKGNIEICTSQSALRNAALLYSLMKVLAMVAEVSPAAIFWEAAGQVPVL